MAHFISNTVEEKELLRDLKKAYKARMRKEHPGVTNKKMGAMKYVKQYFKG